MQLELLNPWNLLQVFSSMDGWMDAWGFTAFYALKNIATTLHVFLLQDRY